MAKTAVNMRWRHKTKAVFTEPAERDIKISCNSCWNIEILKYRSIPIFQIYRIQISRQLKVEKPRTQENITRVTKHHIKDTNPTNHTIPELGHIQISCLSEGAPIVFCLALPPPEAHGVEGRSSRETAEDGTRSCPGTGWGFGCCGIARTG